MFPASSRHAIISLAVILQHVPKRIALWTATDKDLQVSKTPQLKRTNTYMAAREPMIGF